MSIFCKRVTRVWWSLALMLTQNCSMSVHTKCIFVWCLTDWWLMDQNYGQTILVFWRSEVLYHTYRCSRLEVNMFICHCSCCLGASNIFTVVVYQWGGDMPPVIYYIITLVLARKQISIKKPITPLYELNLCNQNCQMDSAYGIADYHMTTWWPVHHCSTDWVCVVDWVCKTVGGV